MDVNKYREKDTKLCKYEFQEFAKQTVEDFAIGKRYQPIIFKHAKNNLVFLKAKVSNLRETAEYKGDDLKSYNKLLIWSLKKNKS